MLDEDGTEKSGNMTYTCGRTATKGSRVGFAVYTDRQAPYPRPPNGKPAPSQVIWAFFTNTKLAASRGRQPAEGIPQGRRRSARPGQFGCLARKLSRRRRAVDELLARSGCRSRSWCRTPGAVTWPV